MSYDNNDKIDINEAIKPLTEKQLDVLCCLLFGLSYKEIGKLFDISNRTVEGHIREISIKTGLKNKKEIISCISLLQDKSLYQQLKDRFFKLNYNKDVYVKPPENVYFFQRYKSKYIVIFFVLLTITTMCLIFFYKNKKNLSIRSIGVNSYLLERKNIIEQVMPTWFNMDNIVAIVGQGGAGKTTIARECLRICGYSIAYEINAETFDYLFRGLVGLAHLLANTREQKEDLSFINGISNNRERIKQISIFIHKRLKELDNWCLVFDNVTDFEMFHDISQINLEKNSNGQIIITTRNNNVGNYFSRCKVIEIGELTEKEKIKLFETIASKKIDTYTKEFISEIPSYPLDISSSAYYIKNTNISLEEYVKRMKKPSVVFWNSNRKIIKDNTSYNNTRESIISSILGQIIKINESFKELLFTLTLMDSQNIPIEFLKRIDDDYLISDLIYHLKKYGLITTTGMCVSIHRSVQTFALNFLKKNLSKEEKYLFIENIASKLTSYEKIIRYVNPERFIPHLKSIVNHLGAFDLDKVRVMLLISLGKLLKEKGISTFDSIECFSMALELNKNLKILDQYEEASVYLDLGEACVISNKNEKALSYLNKSFVSLNFLHRYAVHYAKNYNLLGIVKMRSNQFNKANDSFNKALNIFKDRSNDFSFDEKLVMAITYANKGLNYFLYYINKPEMEQAISMMEEAIRFINGTKDVEGIKILANTKVKIAGAYNGTKRYNLALTKATEAEKLLKLIPSKDNGYFCTLGLILMEKGHATLRLNNLEKARNFLRKARELFDKTMIGDHTFRLRMQEAEALVRLGHFDDAYKNCLEVLEKENREMNDYNELFFNTAHYNAGVIKYKQRDLQKSLKHFKDFSIGMKNFCRNFLTQEKYASLDKKGVFDVISSEKQIIKCFENGFKIFSAVCMEGSEFITDYVQKNYEDSLR